MDEQQQRWLIKHVLDKGMSPLKGNLTYSILITSTCSYLHLIYFLPQARSSRTRSRSNRLNTQVFCGMQTEFCPEILRLVEIVRGVIDDGKGDLKLVPSVIFVTTAIWLRTAMILTMKWQLEDAGNIWHEFGYTMRLQIEWGCWLSSSFYTFPTIDHAKW